MTFELLDGSKLAETVRGEVREEVARFVARHGRPPGIHVVLVGAIIVCAVANERVINEPASHINTLTAAVLIGGPLVYLCANAVYKLFVYQRIPLSHLVGIAALVVLVPFSFVTDVLMVNGLTTLIVIVVAAWESISRARKTEVTSP